MSATGPPFWRGGFYSSPRESRLPELENELEVFSADRHHADPAAGEELDILQRGGLLEGGQLHGLLEGDPGSNLDRGPVLTGSRGVGAGGGEDLRHAHHGLALVRVVVEAE